MVNSYSLFYIFRLKDAGVADGSVICLLGGSLMEDFQKTAYPPGYNRPLATGAPSNVIASRLSAIRSLHSKGVTKVKIPNRSEQSKLEYLKAEMRGEELKVEPAMTNDGASGSTPQKGSYFSRFLPKLPSLLTSPGPKSKSKKGESPRPVDNFIRVLESH